MAKVISFVCDFCGELLVGDNRRVEVARPYISIRGKISLQNQKETGSQYDYIFLTDKDEIDYRFCEETTCFTDYVKMKKDKYINHYKAKLREDAQFELNNPYRRGGGSVNNHLSPEKELVKL